MKFDKRLVDFDFGIYHGQLVKKLKFNSPNIIERFFDGPEQGENWTNVLERMKMFLEDVEKNCKDKNILVVSHAGPLWVLEHLLKGLNKKQIVQAFLKRKMLNVGEFKEVII